MDALPPELLHLVLLHLVDDAADLAAAGKAFKALRAAAADEELWQFATLSAFGWLTRRKPRSVATWRAYYVRLAARGEALFAVVGSAPADSIREGGNALCMETKDVEQCLRAEAAGGVPTAVLIAKWRELPTPRTGRAMAVCVRDPNEGTVLVIGGLQTTEAGTQSALSSVERLPFKRVAAQSTPPVVMRSSPMEGATIPARYRRCSIPAGAAGADGGADEGAAGGGRGAGGAGAVPPLSVARCCAAAASDEAGRLYVAGGGKSMYHTAVAYDSVEVNACLVDPATGDYGAWQPAPNMLARRCGLGLACSLRTASLVAVGGYGGQGNYLRSAEILDVSASAAGEALLLLMFVLSCC